jgi:hypothetical protein
MKWNLDDPGVFDLWRARYDDMTDDDHRTFARMAALRWPDQVHANRVDAMRFFKLAPKEPVVIEAGGWRGELARDVMAQMPIKRWINIEFETSAAFNPVVQSKNYMAIVPERLRWFTDENFVCPMPADVFVSTHMIEHLADDDLLDLLVWVRMANIPMVYIEAPIGDGPSNWQGYYGTHILKMGWGKINAEMLRHGYAYTQVGLHSYAYARAR